MRSQVLLLALLFLIGTVASDWRYDSYDSQGDIYESQVDDGYWDELDDEVYGNADIGSRAGYDGNYEIYAEDLESWDWRPVRMLPKKSAKKPAGTTATSLKRSKSLPTIAKKKKPASAKSAKPAKPATGTGLNKETLARFIFNMPSVKYGDPRIVAHKLAPAPGGPPTDKRMMLYKADIHFSVAQGVPASSPYDNAIKHKGGNVEVFRHIVTQDKSRKFGRYLDYGQNMIYATDLPNPPRPGDPTYFFTAPISGCSVFIDTNQKGDHLFVYHANAQGVADPVKEMQGMYKAAKASWQHLLGEQMTTQVILDKNQYYRDVRDSDSATGVHVVGWWDAKGKSWVFYYQLVQIAPDSKVLEAVQFYPKKRRNSI